MSIEGVMKASEVNVNGPLNEGMKKISEYLPDFAKYLNTDDVTSFYDADKPLDFGVEDNDFKDTIEKNIENLENNVDRYKEDFISSFDEINETIELTSEDLSAIADKIFDYVKESTKDLGNKLGELTPEFDYQAIFESAGTTAAAGTAIGTAFGAGAGGVGAIPGALTGAVGGAISGAAGEITRQVAINNGASNSLATTVKLGTELLTGGVIGKLALNTVSKTASLFDDVSSMIKSTGDDFLVKSGNLFDDGKVFVGDKVKTVIYDTKGLVNDFKVHPFVDAKGNPLSPPMKISEILDISKSIKMDYNRFLAGNSNSAGFERNAPKFWEKYKDLYPEALSKNNLALINKQPNPLSPIVDKKWLEYHPNQKAFLGEKLEHHHLNNTDMVVAVPQTLHRGKLNKDMLHVD